MKCRSRPPAAIYNALTNTETLALWWMPDTRGTSEVGKNLEFRFGDFCQRVEVSRLEPSRRVGWRAADPDPADWAQTEIEFEILSPDEWTRVRFRHSGFREEIERLPYYSLSWAVFLLSLKELLEKGHGFPFPNRWIHL